MELIFRLEEIQNVAKKFIAVIADYKVFALHGEMGAGKTTFVHAVCEVLGVKDVVSSPTFSIINEYKNSNGEIIYHMDLYRIKDEAEAVNAGIEDCFYHNSICFIEWPEKAPGILPNETLHITISVIDEDTRKLKINL